MGPPWTTSWQASCGILGRPEQRSIRPAFLFLCVGKYDLFVAVSHLVFETKLRPVGPLVGEAADESVSHSRVARRRCSSRPELASTLVDGPRARLLSCVPSALLPPWPGMFFPALTCHLGPKLCRSLLVSLEERRRSLLVSYCSLGRCGYREKGSIFTLLILYTTIFMISFLLVFFRAGGLP